MAQLSMGPWKFVLNMGSSSHWVVRALSNEASYSHELNSASCLSRAHDLVIWSDRLTTWPPRRFEEIRKIFIRIPLLSRAMLPTSKYTISEPCKVNIANNVGSPQSADIQMYKPNCYGQLFS